MPWEYHGQEKSLDRVQPVDQNTLERTGYAQNTHFKSVERIDRTKELRDKNPDHLSLPQYSDRFITKNGNDPTFMTAMIKDKHAGSNDLNAVKYFAGLRIANRHMKEMQNEKEKEKYMQERNWDHGLILKKKEDSKFHGD